VQELHKQRYTIREKYREKRKKGSVRNVFALGKLIYDLTIGKRIAWVREMVANVKDMIKEVQGIKQIISGVNKIKRTYGAATTRINTAVWNGRIGKTIIAIKRVGNAVEALKRASFSGLQAGLITGGVALAAGASAPATLALMGTAAGTSFGVKVVADTLNSTRTHFWAPIANLQKKYGVVKYGNVAPYGVKGGLIGPEAPRVNISRLRTFTNSFNWAFYGAGIGAALATVGIVSMPAGIIGGTMLGVGSRYVAGRATNRVGQFLFNKYGYNINKYSGFRMPIFSIVDTSLMPVWLKSQYAEIQQMGLWDYIYARYLNSGQLNWNILRSGFNWLNLGFKGVSTYPTASWMASLGAGATVTSAFSGALQGGITGALLASTLIPGVALGTGALVGATVGAIIGGAIGTYLIPVPFVGTYVGSTVGSFFGAIIGDWFDDKARKAYEDAMKKIKELEAMAKALENLLGSLSLFKGLLDFLNDLDKKFDPAMALGLTLTLTAGMSILVDAGLDVTPSKTDTGSSGSSSSASQKPGGNVAGAQDTKTKPKEYDCLSQKNRKIINPKTSLITRIRVKSGFYEIYTDEFVFRNIKTPNKNLEVDGTLSAGDLVGYCK